VILKNPEIEILPSYVVPPPDEFWETFPKNYPKNLNVTVDVARLERLIEHCQSQWTRAQKLIAEKAVANLKGKNLTKFKHELPGLSEKNAKTAKENRVAMTDVIATWIKKGFVAGLLIIHQERVLERTPSWRQFKETRYGP
jgi:hypothetical protein